MNGFDDRFTFRLVAALSRLFTCIHGGRVEERLIYSAKLGAKRSTDLTKPDRAGVSALLPLIRVFFWQGYIFTRSQRFAG